MVKNSWQQKGDIKVYLTADSSMAVGEYTIDGVKYKFDADGSYKSGWVGGKYYIRGYCLTGFQKLGDKYYYFEDDGSLFKGGWVNAGGAYRHFESDGTASSGLKTISGSTYYFAEDGKPRTGYYKIGTAYYYFDDKGVMVKNKWVSVGADQKYLGADGKAVIGWQKIDNRKYYFLNDGSLAKKTILKIGNEIYRFDEYGNLYTGGWWTTPDKKTYYFMSDGTAATGYMTINGVTYLFGDDGVMMK